jgi:hypothetical protein
MERLRDSGRSATSLPLIFSYLPSPFAFFDELSAYLRDATGKVLQKISQRDLFSLVSAFARQKLHKDCHEALSAALRADFSAVEARRPPKDI